MQQPHSPSPRRWIPSALLGTLLLVGACKSNEAATQSAAPTGPERASIASELSASATVVAVDSPHRIVTLRREDGSLLQVQAGDAVRNFDQIAVGDTLLVRYAETLVASRLAAGTPAKAAEAAAMAGRAAAGAKPGAGAGLALSARVKIESIDREREIVVFSLASGELVARRLATAEGRAFAKGLNVGDTVQLDYTVALAAAIEKL